MKLYVRILLAAGLIEYGTFGICIVLGYTLGWLWYGFGGLWLIGSQRFVRRHLLPPLFPYTRCHCCHELINLTSRWKRGEEWTDGKPRHALQVFSPGEYEIGSFCCPNCRTTIELQKVTKKRLANWTQIDADSMSAGLPNSGDIVLGTVKGSLPSGIEKLVRTKCGFQVGTPAYLSNEILAKHLAMFGATGSGKSTLFLSTIDQLIRRGEGITLLDPTGDLAKKVLKIIPKERVKSLLYLNVEDQENPFPFNVLNETDPNDRNQLPDEIISLFKDLFATSWGDKCTYQLRMAVNAAMEIGGSLADIYDLFADPDARHRIASQLKDPELRNFWEEKILAPNNQSTRYSMINKLTEIVKHPFVGPIVNSRSCIVDGDEVISGRKIVIVNLNTNSKPGATAKLLGTFIVSKIISAAYRQGQLEDEDRVPHFLFADEFQNFVSRSFDWENGLSQVRKYKMSMSFATQYADGIPKRIRSAIFGNVGTLAAFRLGHEDASVLKDEFDCRTKRQLMKQPVGECRVRIDHNSGIVRTKLLPMPERHFAATIQANMRSLIASFRELERDSFQSNSEREREVRMIEEKAMCGELVLCEYA